MAISMVSFVIENRTEGRLRRANKQTIVVSERGRAGSSVHTGKLRSLSKAGTDEVSTEQAPTKAGGQTNHFEPPGDVGSDAMQVVGERRGAMEEVIGDVRM
jgi:hypothetical protein